MLIKSKELKGYKLGAVDGDFGKVEEFYFDDKYWTVRYLVADTAKWIKNRTVLISPYALESIDDFNHRIVLNLNKHQIESSPSWETDLPVSQQYETSYFEYYGYPMYWFGSVHFGSDQQKKWDPNLRSTRAVSGYRIEAIDGEMGHVKDFIIDDKTWEIRYLVVETGNWFSGNQVLISPAWFEKIMWEESMILTFLSQDEIRSAPRYSEQALLDRTYETDLYGHYGFDGYWLPKTAHQLKKKMRNHQHHQHY
jgi:uncharacterized protein YrrD